MSLQVIVVESGTLVARSIARVFRGERCEVVSLKTPARIGELLLSLQSDVIIAEQGLAPFTGLQVLEVARALQPEARRYLLAEGPPAGGDDAPLEL